MTSERQRTSQSQGVLLKRNSMKVFNKTLLKGRPYQRCFVMMNSVKFLKYLSPPKEIVYLK